MTMLVVLVLLPIVMTLDSVTRPPNSSRTTVASEPTESQLELEATPIESSEIGPFRMLLAAWPKLLLLVLVFFLALQFLRLFMRQNRDEVAADDSSVVRTE